MKRVLVLAVALCALVTTPASATTEILQYAERPGDDRAKRRLVSDLRAVGLRPRGFEVLPMVVVSGTPAQLRRAHRLPGVLHHHRGGRAIELHLEKSVPLVFRGPAAPVRAAAGADAGGMRVAVVDTGVDGLHPDLGNRVVHNVEFTLDTRTAAGGGAFDLPPAVVATPCPAACNTDQHGHGTHVAGIIAGPGAAGRVGGGDAGMAPSTEIVGLSVSNSASGLEFHVLAAYDYLLAHPELNVVAVNNSWGLPWEKFEPDHPLNTAIRLVAEAGIAVVFSAGNEGHGQPAAGAPEGSSDCVSGERGACAFSHHAALPWAIGVAAGDWIDNLPERDRLDPSRQQLALFSSRGDPRPQTVGGVELDYTPTLTAPGGGIVSTASTNSPTVAGSGAASGDPDVLYRVASGTSMAAPHVTGAIPILQAAARKRLGRLLKPAEVERVLREGAAPMTSPFAERSTCTVVALSLVYGCDEGACDEVQSAMGCKPDDRPAAAPYERWQVGAGFLDVQGSLRAIDRLASPPAPPSPPAAPAPAAAPAAAPPAAPAAAPRTTAARKAAKPAKRKASKRKARKSTKKRKKKARTKKRRRR